MSLDQVVIEGTLKPDGTLELDQKPSLPPRRVTVMLQPAPANPPTQRKLADVIDEIQRDQQARGFQGRSAEEIEAGLREGEEELLSTLNPGQEFPIHTPEFVPGAASQLATLLEQHGKPSCAWSSNSPTATGTRLAQGST
jgi:hypothetical protein